MHTGLAVICGTEDRQHAYVALTRGTDTNTAYVFTLSPKLADPAPGPRPAPELARYDKHAATPPAGPDPAADQPVGFRDALAVLSDVLERDGQQLSATRTWRQALADADHLAVLHAIWTAETSPAREQRYRDLLLAGAAAGIPARAGPSGEMAVADDARRRTRRPEPRSGPRCCDRRAGPDRSPRRDRRHRRPAPPPDRRPRPAAAGPWAAQLPDIADPERRGYAAQIAAMMDARKDRIGEHAAGNALPWAVSALGPVPEHPVDRLEWQQRAASIGAWRELSGYAHPADPIGPEPAADPDLWAAWHEALAALGPVDGPDVRGMPDGRLLHLRDTYPIETGWAPQWTGEELRQVRLGAADARLAAIRATAEAGTVHRHGQHETALRQQALAASYQAMHDAYREREAVFAAVMADRQQWETATRQQRQLAVAADAELRRRHPGQHFPPLRSAEPEPATQQQRDELTLTAGEDIPQIGQWIADLAAEHRAFAGKLAERQSLRIPAEDPDYEDLGPAFPSWDRPGQGRHPAAAQAPDPAVATGPGTRRRPRPGHGSRRMTDAASTLETRGRR